MMDLFDTTFLKLPFRLLVHDLIWSNILRCLLATLPKPYITSNCNNLGIKWNAFTRQQSTIWSRHSCKSLIIIHGWKKFFWERAWPSIFEAKSCSTLSWSHVVSWRSCLSVEDINTGNCTLEGFVLFGSTKRKLDLPLGFEYDSHRPNKMNYSIPCPHTRATRACIEEPLKHEKSVVSHHQYVGVRVSGESMAHFQITLPIKERVSSIVGQHMASK